MKDSRKMTARASAVPLRHCWHKRSTACQQRKDREKKKTSEEPIELPKFWDLFNFRLDALVIVFNVIGLIIYIMQLCGRRLAIRRWSWWQKVWREGGNCHTAPTPQSTDVFLKSLFFLSFLKVASSSPVWTNWRSIVCSFPVMDDFFLNTIFWIYF